MPLRWPPWLYCQALLTASLEQMKPSGKRTKRLQTKFKFRCAQALTFDNYITWTTEDLRRHIRLTKQVFLLLLLFIFSKGKRCKQVFNLTRNISMNIKVNPNPPSVATTVFPQSRWSVTSFWCTPSSSPLCTSTAEKVALLQTPPTVKCFIHPSW